MTIPIVAPSFDVAEELDSEHGAPLHIVLVRPEIPPNTGSIARLCAGTGAWLHLVKPLGFELDHSRLKRAGLDYWPAVRLSVHESLEALSAMLPWDRTFLFTKKADRSYLAAEFPFGSVLVFGCETKGLPEDWVDGHAERAVRIPMTEHTRSLNLAQAVAIPTFEVIRQRGWIS